MNFGSIGGSGIPGVNGEGGGAGGMGGMLGGIGKMFGGKTDPKLLAQGYTPPIDSANTDIRQITSDQIANVQTKNQANMSAEELQANLDKQTAELFKPATKRQSVYKPSPMAPADQYTTPLTPVAEKAFQTWRNKYAPQDSGADYDLRGAFKAGLTPDQSTGHWPDTYKKPNHPTFSTESIYGIYGKPGTWGGPNHDQYQPYQEPSSLNPFAGGVNSPVGKGLGAVMDYLRTPAPQSKQVPSTPANSAPIRPGYNADENNQLRLLEQLK